MAQVASKNFRIHKGPGSPAAVYYSADFNVNSSAPQSTSTKIIQNLPRTTVLHGPRQWQTCRANEKPVVS
jgi:hypothetical protein